jgi:hypothetical protein
VEDGLGDGAEFHHSDWTKGAAAETTGYLQKIEWPNWTVDGK